MWHTGSCNRGVRESSGEYICLLNSDAIVSDGWAGKLIKTIESDEMCLCTGPMTSSAASPQQIDKLYDKRFEYKFHQTNDIQKDLDDGKLNNDFKLVDKDLITKDSSRGKVTGFCMVFSRKMWDKVGELDPEIPSGGNEADWTIRGLLLGYYPLISHKVYCHHFGRMSYMHVLTSGQKEKVWVQGDNTIIRKHGKANYDVLEKKYWRNLVGL